MNATINQNQMVADAKKNVFSKVIGQPQAKDTINWHFDNFWNNRKAAFPHVFLKAAKGQGKTTIAEAIAKGLFLFDEAGEPIIEVSGDKAKVKKRPFVEINCATIKNLKQFVNQVLVKSVVDKDATIFLDESHNLPYAVQNALLTGLNPNPSLRTTLVVEDYACEIDFRRQTFLFATSEAYKMFPALVDRLEPISLEEYTQEDLAKIVQLGLGESADKADWNTLMEVATVLRGNARAGQRMSEKILAMLNRVTKFNKPEWAQMCKQLSIYPLGLNVAELNLLRYLDSRTESCSLTSLSARTGLGREQLQKDTEMYLQKHGLMEVTTTGRVITPFGRNYLKELRSHPLQAA